MVEVSRVEDEMEELLGGVLGYFSPRYIATAEPEGWVCLAIFCRALTTARRVGLLLLTNAIYFKP